MNNLTTYQCIGNPHVQTITTIQEWFHTIKTQPLVAKVDISKPRQLKALSIELNNKSLKEQYNYYKGTAPTICYNSHLDGYRSKENFISGTGLMYIDLDKDGFDITLLDKSKVYGYYQSFGGIGYHILVRVDGLNLDNYEATFSNIVSDLGLNNYYDTDAKGMAQQAVISFDPNIYVNEDCYVYKVIEESDCTQLVAKNQKKEEHMLQVGYSGENGIRYNNINDFDIDGDYIENWNEGFTFVKCYLPKHKLHDKRKRTMLSYVTNYIWLNPNVPYYQALNTLLVINDTICFKPLPKEYVIKTLKIILDKKNQHTLYPNVTIRRIIFNPNTKLDKEDKSNLCGSLIKSKYRMEGCLRLNGILENWDFEKNGLISIRNIAKVEDDEGKRMDKKTVAKYYKDFKEYVISLNQTWNDSKVQFLMVLAA